jgi:hypothetical protein
METNLVLYYAILPKEIWDKILYCLKVVDVVNFFSARRNLLSQPSKQWWGKYIKTGLKERFDTVQYLKPMFLGPKITNPFVRILVHIEDAKLIDSVTTSIYGIPTKRTTRGYLHMTLFLIMLEVSVLAW